VAAEDSRENVWQLKIVESNVWQLKIPYSRKFLYGGNFRIIRMPCEHTKI